MANPFAKSRPADKPYAIYRAGDMTWHVCKTYKTPANEKKDPYARWLVAAKSEATFGSFDMGDTYALEIKRYGQLVAAEPEWLDEYDIRRGVPTPSEYLANA